MKKIMVVIFAAMLLLWGAGISKAEAYMIDFGIDYSSGDNGGAICYDVNSATLTGTGIEVDNAVSGSNSLLFGASTTTLNFTMTGASDLGGGNYTFAGGVIEILSGDNMFGGSLPVTLLSGDWDSGQVVSLYTLSDGTTKIVFGSFNDSKNDLLLNKLGIPGYSSASGAMIPGFVGGLNLQFIVPAGQTCSSHVYSGDVTNSSVPVPPAAIMLFSGILGLFGVRRIRRDS